MGLKEIGIGLTIVALVVFSMMNTGCQSINQMPSGTVDGNAPVPQVSRRAISEIKGGEIGGATGSLVSTYMDKLAAELSRDIPGISVDRIGEGLVITSSMHMFFHVDSFTLKTDSLDDLGRIVSKLLKYRDTDVTILGHTSSEGDPQYNLAISVKRAESIRDYLVDKRIYYRRLEFEGLGGTDPVISDAVDVGRLGNKRMEFVISASKKLIREARRGKLPQV